jgi:hypothetical protein
MPLVVFLCVSADVRGEKLLLYGFFGGAGGVAVPFPIDR